MPLEVSDLLPVSEMQFKWRADDGTTLDASLEALYFFYVIQTRIAFNTILF